MKDKILLNQLTFTRFFAAVLIVCFHFGKEVFPFNHSELSFLIVSATVWVGYFFVLSGFILVVAYYREEKLKIDSTKFWINRFARIYPVYFFALGLMLVFLFKTKAPVDFFAVLLNLFLLQAWFPSFPLTINLVGWSLSVEVFFYFIFPFLFNYFYRQISLIKLSFFALFLWFLTQLFFNLIFKTDFYYKGDKVHNLIFYFPLMHLNEFLLGNIAGLFFVKYFKEKKFSADVLILLLFFSLFLLLKYPILNYHDGFLAVVFLPLILFLSFNNGIFSKILSYKPFVLLGEMSYGIYILQLPVFYYCEWLLKKVGWIDFLALKFYFSFIVLLAVSFLSYRYLETPMRNYLKIRLNYVFKKL